MFIMLIIADLLLPLKGRLHNQKQPEQEEWLQIKKTDVATWCNEAVDLCCRSNDMPTQHHELF